MLTNSITDAEKADLQAFISLIEYTLKNAEVTF